MRPGFLYFTVFVWLVSTGGRYTARFLQEIANMEDTIIGIVLAVHVLVSSLLGAYGAVYADRLEQRYPGHGRILVLLGGIICSTLAFELHGLIRLLGSTMKGEEEDTARIEIILHIIARIVFAGCSSMIFPVLDGITLSFLKLNEQHEQLRRSNDDSSAASSSSAVSYGQERLFGAVGWAVASFGMGLLIDRYGFTIFFWTAPVGCLFVIICGSKYRLDNVTGSTICTTNHHKKQKTNKEVEMIEERRQLTASSSVPVGTVPTTKEFDRNDDDNDNANQPKDEEEEEEEDDDEKEVITKNHSVTMTPQHHISNIDNNEYCDEDTIQGTHPIRPHPRLTFLSFLRSILGTSTALGFLFSAITLCMGTSIVESLIFLYFEQDLGGSNTVCGVTVVVTVLFEIPLFYYAPRLLQRYGPQTLQQVACVAYIVRVVGYTFIPEGYILLVLFLEPLHGITYACSKTSAVEFAARLTHQDDGHESSAQGFVSLLLGLGTVVGLVGGGYIEDRYGPVRLYRAYAGIVALGLCVLSVTLGLDPRRRIATRSTNSNTSTPLRRRSKPIDEDI